MLYNILIILFGLDTILLYQYMLTSIVPDTTFVTCCYLLDGGRKLDILEKQSSFTLSLPYNMVIFCDKHTESFIRKYRANFMQYTQIHVNPIESLSTYQFIDKIKENRTNYFPTEDDRTNELTQIITCNKFDFMLTVIENNPFNTTLFTWIDSLLGRTKPRICEHYHGSLIPQIISKCSNKFHIMVIGQVDSKFLQPEFYKEYYSEYRYLVAGGFFVTGKQHGNVILNRLKEIFVEHTNAGVGHGEEMLYLDIIENYQQHLVTSYGDYGIILDNFITPTIKIDYIYQLIIYKYLSNTQYSRAKHALETVLHSIHNFTIHVDPDSTVQLWCDYIIASYYLSPYDTISVIENIYSQCIQHYPYSEVFKQYKTYIGPYIRSINETFNKNFEV